MIQLKRHSTVGAIVEHVKMLCNALHFIFCSIDIIWDL
jgi:hypothetical protein